LIGALPVAAERVQEWSPEYQADQIRDPLAIFQGGADKVVPPEQSERIVERLRANRVPHVYRLYEGEGHGFRKAETLVDYYQTAERFLREHVIFRG
ncbi:MAG: prolyl oligopeptidase family serine peptidase, partial [Anaerolineaceae bacterium]